MTALFASGRIIDLILAMTALEAIALALWHRQTGRGIAPRDYLANLISGACILVALRLALVAAWWGWIGLSLAAALAAHAVELRRRWAKTG